MMTENCADILRGSLDPTDYRQPVMTLKKLNDTFEENAEKLIQEGKSEKETYGNKNRHYFFVPEDEMACSLCCDRNMTRDTIIR